MSPPPFSFTSLPAPGPPGVHQRICFRKRGNLWQRGRFDAFLGWSFDSTLGYPGEGPNYGRRVRNPGGSAPNKSDCPPNTHEAQPAPATPVSSNPTSSSSSSGTQKRPPGGWHARFTREWLFATLLPVGLCAAETSIVLDGADAVLKTLNQTAANAAYYRRKDYADAADDEARGGRSPSLDVSMEWTAQRQRVRLICRDMYRAIADRPESDQALAINELIETYMPRSVRLQLRSHNFVEREQYVAVRAAVYNLREKYWTAENWLELRLCKYIATGVFRLGHKLFSMVQNSDGVWESQVLVPMPSNINRARQDHVYSALLVPSPFRNPTAVADAQKEVLKHHDFEVSEDGKCAVIDIFGAARSAHGKAVLNKNLDKESAPRMQT